MPTALGVAFFMLVDKLQQAALIPQLLQRPAETIETYLYFFILAYLLALRPPHQELEVAEGAIPNRHRARDEAAGQAAQRALIS